jgi:hypothetical protein
MDASLAMKPMMRCWCMAALARGLVLGIIIVGVSACATSRPNKRDVAPMWPDEWGIEFALRCTAAGNDVRLCTCMADEIKKRWTPAEFKSVAADALKDQMQRCRERLRLDGS